MEDLCISLCHACHMAHHNGREPNTEQLVTLMWDLYKLDLPRLYPHLLGIYAVDHSSET